MDMKNLSKTRKLTISSAVMALYIVVMYFTQSFAFGQYQVRIATAICSVAYLFPFLLVPLGLSNCIANMVMGGWAFLTSWAAGLLVCSPRAPARSWARSASRSGAWSCPSP